MNYRADLDPATADIRTTPLACECCERAGIIWIHGHIYCVDCRPAAPTRDSWLITRAFLRGALTIDDAMELDERTDPAGRR